MQNTMTFSESYAQLQQQTYLPKADLQFSVLREQERKFVEATRRFALDLGFTLKHDGSGMPLRDGRRIVYLVFERLDGAEILVTDILKPGEFSTIFYDKRETGDIKKIIDRFLAEFSEWPRAGPSQTGS